jgi:hypothetical protein
MNFILKLCNDWAFYNPLVGMKKHNFWLNVCCELFKISAACVKLNIERFIELHVAIQQQRANKRLNFAV